MAREQLREWIKIQKSKGYSNEQINRALVQKGFKEQDIRIALRDTDQQLKYSAKSIGAVNLLFYGSGYFFLRRYARFGVAFFALVAFGTMLGWIGAALCYLGVIIDTTRLAKKVHGGSLELPKANTALATLLIAAVILVTLYSFTPKYLLAYSEESCDLFYPKSLSIGLGGALDTMIENAECKQKILNGETWFSSGPDQNFIHKECESSSGLLKDICYFDKAWDSTNPAYCKNTSEPSLCLESLAWLLLDMSLCEGSDQKRTCEETFDRCTQISDPPVRCEVDTLFSCKGLSSEVDAELRLNCIRKFGIA